MARLAMQQMLHSLEELPPLPSVAVTIMNKTLNDTSELDDIIPLVEADQSLSLKVLALANSPAFLGYRKMATVREAIVFLGLNRLKSLALSVTVLDALQAHKASGFPYEAHWRHSLACAFCARRLAQKTGNRELAEEAFMAGVLHDVGKVVMSLCFPQQYQQVLAETTSQALSLLEAERKVFGCDHALVGRWTLERWRLPLQLQEATWLHHHALSLLMQRNESSSRLAAFVAAANMLCNLQGWGQPSEVIVRPQRWWELFALSEQQGESVTEGVAGEVEGIAEAIGLGPVPTETCTEVLQLANRELGKMHLTSENRGQDLNEKLGQFSALQAMGKALQATTSMVEGLGIIAEHVLQGFQGQTVWCSLFLGKGRALEVQVVRAPLGEVKKTSMFREAEGVEHNTSRAGCISVELIAQKKVLGMLTLRRQAAVQGRREDDIERLGLFAQMGALALAQTHLVEHWKRQAEEFATRSDTLQRTQDDTRFFTHLLTSVSDGIFGVNPEGGIRFCNPMGATLLGQRVSAMVGKPLDTVFPEAVRQEVADCCQEALRSQKPVTYEFTRKTESGERQCLSLVLVPIRNEKGESNGMVATLRDVTATRELERERRHADKMNALGQLASGVAHNFNNLLTTILGRSQLLQMEKSPENMRKGLQLIEQTARDGAAIIQRLQRFINVQEEKSAFVQVDATQVLEDAVEITRPYWETGAQAQGKTITVYIARQAVPAVLGVPSELREVFVNMILNAVEAMPQGGELRLKTAEVQGQVRVFISDTGVGIPADLLGRVFDPFFTTKGVGNSGLGLSTAFEIVKRHKGEITVESVERHGTTFIISLPAPLDAQRPSPQPPPLAPERGHKARILLVEDETAVGDILEEMLVLQGHEVRKAQSGIEAIRAFQDTPCDLVFTDLGMPTMNGYELAQHLKRLKPSVQVVLVTGWGHSIDATEAKQRGIDHILPKPFTITEVTQLLHEILASS